MRLIDADDLRQVLEVFSEKDSLGHTPVQLCDAMPTIDAVEVVHGEWIKYEDGTICSNCGFALENWTQGIFYNYCPNCGAKMEGKEQKE